MSNPRFSIVIPAFNAAKYLPATLDSIKCQDFCGKVQVIIIDGGSSDDTKDVVREYGDLVSVFVSEPDSGQLDALQKGLKIASGEICHWLNADDVMMPGALSYVSEQFDNCPVLDLVYSDNFAFADGGSQLYVGSTIKGLSYRQHVLFYRQMYSECVYWRREATRYLPVEMFDLRVYTDYAFFGNLRYGLCERWVSKRLGAFRIRPGQASVRNAARKSVEFRRVRAWFYKQRGWTRAEVFCRRLRNSPEFFLFQFVRPRMERGVRRIIRALTRDRTRAEQSRIFFDYWMKGLKSPEDIAAILLR